MGQLGRWSAAVTVLFGVLLLSSPPLSSSEKVTVSVYYEALCPFCANFVVYHLVKLFENGLISAVNLRMIPWGNAWIQPDGAFSCQHGPDECMLNTIEACTISIYPDTPTKCSLNKTMLLKLLTSTRLTNLFHGSLSMVTLSKRTTKTSWPTFAKLTKAVLHQKLASLYSSTTTNTWKMPMEEVKSVMQLQRETQHFKRGQGEISRSNQPEY
ncbi:uncharacterized protein LOC120074650 isoform X2 [Benincasa hispida]|uniref:uncharacterized protein LOC120074650 isoform X2 n=1 Tax=Benincasa hispida TaxID=102211 RepID=UPI001901FD9E|nr:uncharacterized protein LOC120074650 isoform X2 [Benincasa hispida]